MSEPIVAQKGPFVKEEKKGAKVAWCACGRSQNQPYCDGSHKRLNTGLSPIVVEVDKDGKVAWCGCKHSGTKPFCDGTHRKI